MRITKRGFTLIELMIVMGIVAVLGGAVAFISVPGNLQKGRDGRRQTDLEAIRSALEIYRSDLGTYPNGTASLQPTYITTVPTDPKTPASPYPYTPSCATPPCTVYTKYSLCADLEKVAGVNDYCVTNP